MSRLVAPDEVVMESAGSYWKSSYAALETAGIRAKVVNARHVKNVPGRKTDVSDAHWLATLARAGLLRGSFMPPAKLRQLRQLRLIARQRQKLVGQLAAEKNRLHKALTDGDIRLGVVVSDLHGKSARAMVKATLTLHNIRFFWLRRRILNNSHKLKELHDHDSTTRSETAIRDHLPGMS